MNGLGSSLTCGRESFTVLADLPFQNCFCCANLILFACFAMLESRISSVCLRIVLKTTAPNREEQGKLCRMNLEALWRRALAQWLRWFHSLLMEAFGISTCSRGLDLVTPLSSKKIIENWLLQPINVRCHVERWRCKPNYTKNHGHFGMSHFLAWFMIAKIGSNFRTVTS